MRIARVGTEGLQGVDRELELAPLTLLRGPVGSGKTAISNAVRIACLGCVPSIGRDTAATARLMRTRELRVALALKDGRTIERGYRRHGDRMTGFATASWLPPKSKLTDVVEAIRGLVGRDDREAAEALDLRQLLSCSPAERARRIEELLDASGIPVEDLVIRAEAMTILRLADVELDRMPDEPSRIVNRFSRTLSDPSVEDKGQGRRSRTSRTAGTKPSLSGSVAGNQGADSVGTRFLARLRAHFARTVGGGDLTTRIATPPAAAASAPTVRGAGRAWICAGECAPRWGAR